MDNGSVSSGIGAGEAYVNDVVPFRLDYESASTLILRMYAPNYVAPNQAGFFDSLTLQGLTLDSSSELVDNEGAVISGVAPSSLTAYFVYLMGSGPVSGQLRASATAPTLSGGRYILGTATGVSESSVLVGAFYLNGLGEFEDTESFRGVLTYWNRRPKSLFACPGYNNDNANTNLPAFNSATWSAINSGTGASVVQLAWTDTPTIIAANWTLGAATTAVATVGVHTPDLAVGDIVAASSFGNGALLGSSASASQSVNLRPIEMVVATTWTLKAVSAANLTLRADNARNGAGADPAMTYLSGTFLG